MGAFGGGRGNNGGKYAAFALVGALGVAVYTTIVHPMLGADEYSE